MYRSGLNDALTRFATGLTLGLKNAINGKIVKEIHLRGLDNEGCGIVNNSWELDMRNPQQLVEALVNNGFRVKPDGVQVYHSNWTHCTVYINFMKK